MQSSSPVFDIAAHTYMQHRAYKKTKMVSGNSENCEDKVHGEESLICTAF